MTNEAMKHPYLVPGLIVVGLFLLVLGLGWNRVSDSDAYWDEGQATEYATAQAELHAKSHTHSDDPRHAQEVAAAKERFIKSYQALEHARTTRNRTGTLLMAGGIVLLLAGIFVHLAGSRSE
jgi:hypothetical protein